MLRTAFIRVSIIVACCIFMLEPARAQQTTPKLPTELRPKIDRFLADLKRDSFDVRDSAEKELRKLLLADTKTFDAILAYLKPHVTESTSAETRIRLKRATAPYLQFGITGLLLEKFPDIASQLTSPDFKIRKGIIRQLADSGLPDAVRPLIQSLLCRHRIIHVPVTKALVKLGKMAVEPLIETLSSPDKYLRSQAANLLGSIGDPRAIKPLAGALGDCEESVSWAAASALGQMNSIESVKPLIKVLEHPKTYARAAAARLLGYLKDTRAVKPLVGVLDDADASVRTNAAKALGSIVDPQSVQPLVKLVGDSNSSARWAAMEALVNIGKPSVGALVTSLGSGDAVTRQTAAYALGRIGDKEAIEPLVKALGDPKWYVRGAAAMALGRLGDAKAVQPLVKALSDKEENVRASAVDSLLRIGKSALKPLQEALAKEKHGKKRDRLKEIVGKITGE
jgi:HEAT repeat protein